MIVRLEFMMWEDTTDIPSTISSTSATSSVLTDWWVQSTTSPEALWRLFYELARHQHQLELHITPTSYYNSSSSSSSPFRNGGRSSWSEPSHHNTNSHTTFRHQHQRDSHPSLYTMKLIPILQRARHYRILSQLVLAHHSLWDPPPQHHHLQQQWSNRAYSLIFEILANQSLETLHINLPSSVASVAGYPPPPPPQQQQHDCSTTTNQHHHNPLLRSLGYAIAMNPCLKQLFLYSYRDWDGHATATMLEPLAHKPNTVQELYIYCPLPGRIRGSAPIISTVSQILQAPTCTLRQLEITCIRHHTMEMTGGDNDHSTTTSDFPLRELVQEGILCNHTASLTSLGLLHCGLTTNQVDQDLLYPLLVQQHSIGGDSGSPSAGCSSSLAHIYLDGNRIDSLYFPLFMQTMDGGGVLPSSMVSHPTKLLHNNGGALTTVHMDHNPWQQQPPHRLLLLHVPPLHCHGPPFRRRGHHHHHDSPGYPSTNAMTDCPVDDSPPFLLSTMLLALFQRHPRLIHFGVDPSSSSAWRLFSQNLHHPHQQYQHLAFSTALNRSGLRPKHDDLIRLPLGVWPWVLHRVAAVLGGGGRIAYPPSSTTQQSHHPESQSLVHHRTKNRTTNGRPPRQWKYPAQHQPNERQPQEQHRQMEYQHQSSLIYYILLHYHPWMIRVP